MPNLNKYISFNSDFRDSVNLYLDLNKTEKINSYIPTKSSIAVLKTYLESVINNKMQSTLLIGPYGKGKSHLLLLIMAIMSMDRKEKLNEELIKNLADRVGKVDSDAEDMIKQIWKKGRFLPILIMSTQGDLNQAFMVGLNEALKREGLTDVSPDTYYSYALDIIDRWKRKYKETYNSYLTILAENKLTEKDMIAGLKSCDKSSLDTFKKIYPKLTAGEMFNPLVNSEVLPMFSTINDKLVNEYGFSGMFIVFDEFSKYIESQDKKTAGNNMKLLQDVCELANSSKNEQLFFTMVAHKSIKEYGKYLSAEIINSFTGIEGRIKEIYFITSSKNNYELIQNAIYKQEGYENVEGIAKQFVQEKVDDYYQLASFASEFTKEDFEKVILKGCYPLSPTSAYLLLNVSEKVAQNERTLFTFISKDEPYSVVRHVNECADTIGENWVVSASLIYDYFKTLFKKDVVNTFIHNIWLQAEYALGIVKDAEQRAVIKSLAIILIVNKPDEMPSDRNALILASGVKDPDAAINRLVEEDLIYKKASNNSFTFKTRATSELKTEVKKRKDLKAGRTNSNLILSQVSDTHYVLPKRYNDEFKMTRYFRYEFMSVEEFMSLKKLRVVVEDGKLNDGKFLALYSENELDETEAIKDKIRKNHVENLAIIYSRKPFTVLDSVIEYDVIQDIKNDALFFKNEENKILEKEIPIIEEELEKVISDYIESAYGNDSDKLVMFWNGNEVCDAGKLSLSDVADVLCRKIYNASVKINNELINKEYITTAPIKKVRKILIDQFLGKENMNTYLSGTSAEATIYRALFIGTGLLDKPEVNAENAIKVINKFIDDAGRGKKSLTDLIDKLTAAPIGMRRGVIPIYLAYAISCRHEDIVIYFGMKEVQIDSGIVLNMCENPEDYALFISSESAKKENYLRELSELFEIKDNNKAESRIHTILVGMQRWYRALPQIAKNLKKKNVYWESNNLANAYPTFKETMQSVEANPYEVLFVTLPEAFGREDDLDKLVYDIKELKKKLAGYYKWMIEKTAEATLEIFDPKKKNDLTHALSEWYQAQSDLAKYGLQSTKITNLMACIADNKSFDSGDAAKKVVRAVTDMYMDTWNDLSFEQYIEELKEIKEEIESLKDTTLTDLNQQKLTFTGKSGETIECYYSHVDENTGAILRNIIADTLEDFSDLSVNDKVAILLEMITKELGK